ncbi:hypothetical protein HMPREF1548_01668 [Clostridium sp. KLE 1755]|jgi:hypothetical protein|nr:hypothetical protein HMPREF1548_01668 [Clostridium sp. KLE 1755]
MKCIKCTIRRLEKRIKKYYKNKTAHKNKKRLYEYILKLPINRSSIFYTVMLIWLYKE